MAWPYSPRTTYVANNVPAIKAADLNAFQTAINSLYGFPPFFGDGSDGAFSSSSGTTILTANKNYTTFSLSGTAEVAPDCHIISAQQYIQLRGTSVIDARGTAGTDNSTTAGGGAGSANQTLGTGGAGGAGGSGGVGSAGTSKTNTSLGGSGGAGGQGGEGPVAGGAGGTASLNAQLEARSLTALLSGYLLGYNGSSYGAFPIQGGAGGGGGTYTGPSLGNDGVGGGGGGGVIILCAPVIDVGSGCLVRATGGAGGSGNIAPGDSGGGGGGGGGGVIILVCTQLIETGTISVAGGAGGTSEGEGTGVSGSAGTIIRRVIFS